MSKQSFFAKKYFSPPMLLLYIVLGAAVLRLWGIFGEFWLDEIQSYFLVSKLHSPLEVITKLFDDNNHPLNSLFMYCIGKGDPTHWFKFRLLSLLVGTLTVPIVYFIAAKMFSSQVWRLIMTALIATSFPLIFYSSEARGYALVVFFSVSSFYLLWELFEKKDVWLLVAFYCSFILGFLSSFSFAYIAFGLISTYIWFQWNRQDASGLGQRILEGLKVFALPVILVGSVYLKFVSHLHIEGGPVLPLVGIIKDIAAHLVGFSQYNVCSYGIAIVVYLLLLKEMFDLFKEASPLGIFCISTILGICFDVLWMHPPFVYFRYFFCFFPFLLILLCSCLYRVTVQCTQLKWPVAVVMALILLGNGVEYFYFIKFGRGHYKEALEYIYQHSQTTPVTIGGDQAFQILMPLKFYILFEPDVKTYFILPVQFKNIPPEWFIMQAVGRKLHAHPFLKFSSGPTYTLEKVYLYCGELSGNIWLLYHRHPLPPTVSANYLTRTNH